MGRLAVWGFSFHFREDGYFNMTKAAKVWGKRLDNWLRLNETQGYLEALEALIPQNRGTSLIQVQRGNGNLPTVGTWGHPKLAVRFSQWLDVRFAAFLSHQHTPENA